MGVLGGYECPFSVFDGRATAYARNLQKLNEYMMAFTASLLFPLNPMFRTFSQVNRYSLTCIPLSGCTVSKTKTTELLVVNYETVCLVIKSFSFCLSYTRLLQILHVHFFIFIILMTTL